MYFVLGIRFILMIYIRTNDLPHNRVSGLALFNSD
ncbi:MAG: hypothetical protein JWQ84_483 [Mucilaginibacter sp.]|nr:hypothetical protein [Mucilaginibacter sp.]MDB5015651.1 hypothetical protein [Mucilaginibacter sp.]MDB5138546.1 hypothetical protein [Mucilaginibacter sp.]